MGAYADDTKLTINQAIRIAADQKVQCQRVASIYLSLCNDMMEPKFYQERDAAIELFDHQLRQLSHYTPTEDIKHNLQRVRDLWEPYKRIAGWSIKKDAASKLLKQTTGMLQATKSLYKAYVQYQKSSQVTKESSDLITINEYVKQNTNQRVLIQRIVMYYLAERQNIDAVLASKTHKDAQKAFLQLLNILNNAKITSTAIKTNLSNIQQEWASLEQHLNTTVNHQDEAAYMKEFYHSAEYIASILNKISTQYEDLAVKLSLSHSLNNAITQTVLVQKIAKCYVASQNEVLSYQQRKLVTDYVTDFEQGIESMLNSAPTDAIVRDLNVVKTMWKNYKRIVTDFENIDEIRIVRAMELGYIVMSTCDRVTASVRDYAEGIPAYQRLYIQDGRELAPSLDITYHIRSANHLRGFSERIALYFMLKNAGIDQDISCKRLQECLISFEQQLDLLNNSTLNTVATQKLIESCQNEWSWIKNACKDTSTGDVLLMVENSTLLGKKLKKLCKLYEYKMNDMFAADLEAQETPTASASPLSEKK